MKSKMKLWVAGLAALLLGMPLAEEAAASSGWDITWSAFGLAASIADAAGSS